MFLCFGVFAIRRVEAKSKRNLKRNLRSNERQCKPLFSKYNIEKFLNVDVVLRAFSRISLRLSVLVKGDI